MFFFFYCFTILFRRENFEREEREVGDKRTTVLTKSDRSGQDMVLHYGMLRVP